MAILDAAAAREAAKRRKTMDVDVPDMGTVRLRAMSAGDALRFRAEVAAAEKEGGDSEQLAAVLIARAWVGEDGAVLFTEEEGVEVVRELSASVYAQLAQSVLQLNGLAAAATGEAVKN
jgi:hypothetical protein